MHGPAGSDPVDRSPVEPPPPFGSWARTYALVCLLAVAVMALLYWFTAHYQIRQVGE